MEQRETSKEIMSKCTFKIHEFVAYDDDLELVTVARHGQDDESKTSAGAVAALTIGPTSGQLLATASASGKQITLWKIGRQAALGTLHAANTAGAVPTVIRFDHYEHRLLVGTSRGQLLVYDLQQWKQGRSIAATQSAITCVDWHPLNQHLISCGTKDNRVKIFDTRTKQEFQVSTAHDGQITTLRFSPDGRWLVTGSSDTTLKIWDLTKGAVLHTFSEHDAPVISVAFHPTEFVMASADQSGKICVHDLQEFSVLCFATMGQASLIRDVIFAESPPEIFSQEEAEEHQVVLLGISETCFRVWDISQNNRSEELSKHGDQSELPCLDEVKISWPFLKEIWIGTTKKKTENQPQANPSYHLHMLGVGCNNSVVSVWGADMMRVAPFNGQSGEVGSAVALQSQAQRAEADKGSHEIKEEPPQSHMNQENQTKQYPIDLSNSPSKEENDDGDTRHVPQREKGNDEVFCTRSLQRWSRRRLVPAQREHPIGLDIKEFLPKASPNMQATAVVASLGGKVGMQAVNRRGARLRAYNKRGPGPTEEHIRRHSARNEPVDNVLHESQQNKESCACVLQERLTSIRTLSDLWTSGDLNVAGFVEYLKICEDHSVVADVLRTAHLSGSGISLDMASQILPVIRELMDRKFSDYQEVSLRTSFSLCKAFSSLISSSLSHGTPTLGVDVAGEERTQRCQDAFNEFVSIYKRALSLQSSSDKKIGQLSKEVLELFEAQLPIGNAI